MNAPVSKSPYPPSTCIKGPRWLTEPIRYPGIHGDTWSCTWGDVGQCPVRKSRITSLSGRWVQL